MTEEQQNTMNDLCYLLANANYYKDNWLKSGTQFELFRALEEAADLIDEVDKAKKPDDYDMVCEENAVFANFLGDRGYTKEEIDLIANGWHGSVRQFDIRED